jgi:hypothetical protein
MFCDQDIPHSLPSFSTFVYQFDLFNEDVRVSILAFLRNLAHALENHSSILSVWRTLVCLFLFSLPFYHKILVVILGVSVADILECNYRVLRTNMLLGKV